MAPGQDYVVLVAAIFEVFQLPVVVAVVDYSLKYEFVLSEGPCLIEGNHIGSSAQGNFLWLAHENLFLLQVQDGVVYCQIEDHRQLGRHHCCENEDAP